MRDRPFDITRPFRDAAQAEFARRCHDIRTHEERALHDDCRPRPPFVPCPEHIGNDPCDDQNPWMDEDY